MGHKHERVDILEGALDTAFADGLSRLTYGRVARRLGIDDRIVVYYFPSKEELVSEVLLALGARLQATLGAAFASPARDHVELVRTAWPVLADPAVDPVFALFFEANGLAATGQAPYSVVVPQLVVTWVDWVAERIEGPADERRTQAEAAVALVDGLLLLRQLAGPEAAERAAGQLGVGRDR